MSNVRPDPVVGMTPSLVFDEAHSQYEERWFTLGHTDNAVLLAVAHTYQATSANRIRIRIISARPATKQERRFYADNPR